MKTTEENYEIALQRIQKVRDEDNSTLDLSGLLLPEIPKEVFDLQGLKELYLFCNLLSKIPDEIKFLTELEDLHLMFNPTSELSPEIFRLHYLQRFSILSTESFILPKEAGFSNLKMLWLSTNQKDSQLLFNLIHIDKILINGIGDVRELQEQSWEEIYYAKRRYKMPSNIPEIVIRQGTQAIKTYLSES